MFGNLACQQVSKHLHPPFHLHLLDLKPGPSRAITILLPYAQRLPLSTDSEQKKHRKEELERQLAEVEKDIKALERGEVILVVDE